MTQVQDTKNADYDKIVDLLKSSGRVSVGVHASEGQTRYEDGTTIAEVAEYSEFGIGQPQRSWLRAWFDESKTQIEAQLEREYARAIELRLPFETAANRVGAWAAASIQRRIRNGIEPPNSPITIEAKGSSTPLIDSGRFRSAIMWNLQRITSEAA